MCVRGGEKRYLQRHLWKVSTFSEWECQPRTIMYDFGPVFWLGEGRSNVSKNDKSLQSSGKVHGVQHAKNKMKKKKQGPLRFAV